MDNQHYGKLFSFIWNIANDVLVFAFEKGDCKPVELRTLDEIAADLASLEKSTAGLLKEIMA